jgi:predicted aspartyl protease
MNRTTVTAFAIAMMAASIGAAQSLPTYETTTLAAPVDIEMPLAGAHIVVDGVFVNGEGPFRFLIDTGGMGAGRIDTTLVEKLGLEPSGEIQAGDGTGRGGPVMPLFELETLKLGDLSFEQVTVASRDYNGRARAIRGHIDGILGFGLFREYLLTLDYPNGRLRVTRGELPEPGGAGSGHIVATDAASPHMPSIPIRIGEQETHAHVDTGSMGGLTIPATLVEKLELVDEPKVVGQARTVSGAFDISEATFAGSVELAGHTIDGPTLTFAEVIRHANLGSRVLQDFALTFDQASGRLKLDRTRQGPRERPDARPRERLGIAVAPADDHMLINRVLPGEAAEKAGLMKDDRITAINGRKIADIDPADKGTAMQERPLRLTVQRDGETLTIVVE